MLSGITVRITFCELWVKNCKYSQLLSQTLLIQFLQTNRPQSWVGVNIDRQVVECNTHITCGNARHIFGFIPLFSVELCTNERQGGTQITARLAVEGKLFRKSYQFSPQTGKYCSSSYCNFNFNEITIRVFYFFCMKRNKHSIPPCNRELLYFPAYPI